MADFSHDDLMFAARVAGMKRGPRGGGELAAALTTPGDDGTNDLVRTLVGGMMRERELKMENQLRRQAAEEDFNRRAALEREQGDRADTRLFAELGARRSSEDRARTGAVEDRNFAAKTAKDAFEARTKATEARADKTAKERRAELEFEATGQWPAEGGGSTSAAHPAGGMAMGKVQREALTNSAIKNIKDKVDANEISMADAAEQIRGLSNPDAILQAAMSPRHRPEEIEPLRGAVEQLRPLLGDHAKRGEVAYRAGVIAKAARAADPAAVGSLLQPLVEELFKNWEATNDSRTLELINQIKGLQGFEAFRPKTAMVGRNRMDLR